MKSLYSIFFGMLVLGTAVSAKAQILVHEQGFNSSSFSPWTEMRPSETTADWSTVSSGSNPSATVQEGSRMAEFDSYYSDSYDEARISSPDLNLTGAEVAELRFWMYHDTGDSGSNDKLMFQVSTDGGDIYYTKLEFFRYDGTNGWREEVIPLGYYTTMSNLRVAFRGKSRNGQNVYIDHVRVYKDTLVSGVEGKACNTTGECNSGICSDDPGGNGRCRDALGGHDCIDGHRMPVSAGTVTCYGGDVATCASVDNWIVQSCYDDCGAYIDTQECELGECVDCPEFCDPIFGTGCDPNAYCAWAPFPFPRCFFQAADGEACDSNEECVSDNCVSAPGGGKFCEPSGTPCAADDGSPVAAGTSTCRNNDLWTCQAGGGWSTTDCYTNCGFYDDVDACTGNACATCATSCNGDGDCKPGILCIGNECVGNLPDGSTCTLDTQCESEHCKDGVCCADVCTIPCHRCDLAGSLGVCTPLGDGQDPDNECQGDGVCDGTCNGLGACRFPGNTTVCAECARCNGFGQCDFLVLANTDPLDECAICEVCSGSGPGCVSVTAGSDPLGECEQQSESSCGLDGTCDGAGACRNWPLGTECGVGSCTNGNAVFPDVCDGSGLCTDGGSGSCGFYRCADASRCADSCTTHATCVAQGFCDTQGACSPDLGEGADCENIVYPGQLDDAACMGGYCFDDNFDGQGAFCTSDPAGCVNDGMVFNAGYALCEGSDWYRICEGGALGWGEQIGCDAGLCDAGGGAGSGYRIAGACTSGPGGGCTAACQSCEPYMAASASACRTDCSLAEHCWDGYACQGGECTIPEGIGDPCESQADCSIGFCVDDVCCTTECLGACRACDRNGHEGFCTLVSEGEDPDSECTALPELTCSTTGGCNGQGSCERWPAGTVCGQAHCEGSVLKGGAACNGVGDCLPEQDVDCRPGRCQADSCIQTCSLHEDCDPVGFCAAGGTCQIDLADEESCEGVVHADLERDPACLGDYCFDDSWSGSGAYCASDETACVAVGQSYGSGFRLCNQDEWFRVCLGGAQGWGGEVTCAMEAVCDAGGGPTSGILPAEVCTSGMQGGCDADCVSCFPYLASEPGICAASCVEDANCWPGFTCPSGTCEPGAGLGETCSNDGDCSGWTCVDDVCCNTTCDGPCKVCNDPVAVGVCLFVREGTDPTGDCDVGQEICGTTGSCGPSGSCALAPEGSECAPPTCQDGVLTGLSTCDGEGNCLEGPAHECVSGRCEDDHCAPVETDGGTDGGDGGVPDAGDQGDLPPVAEAGSTQVVSPGSEVTLDGSESHDPNGGALTFLWAQTSGPGEVSLSGSTTPRPTFTAVNEGVYVFRLVVNDGAWDSAPDFTEVQVTSQAGGCGCAGGRAGGPLWMLLLVVIWWLRRRP